jgi:NAD(P) transhydrogenase subunit alpha
MIIGVPKETFPGERRVALIPTAVATLVGAGLQVRVEHGAGTLAGIPDAHFEGRGAQIVTRSEVFAAEVVVQVRSLGMNPQAGHFDLELVRESQVLIGMCDPLGMPEEARMMANRGVTLFALELMPRITRAQSMDVLSSMATIAGYKGVLLAANTLPKLFPMLMTAAGTITPAKVFIVGVGVAGLQAIASARRLGAVVTAYDVRPAVKEQVQSLGAKFIEMPLETSGAEGQGGYAKAMDEEFYRKQRDLMLRVIAEQDVVITTAAVPGKRAPILITEEMVKAMLPGSVIVDLAAERGGNCELTRPGEDVEIAGVTILGPTNLPSDVPYHASQMFAKNTTTFLQHLVKLGLPNINVDDEIIRETLVAREGQITHPRVQALLESSA